MKLTMSQHMHRRTLLAKIAVFLMVMLMTISFAAPVSAAGYADHTEPVTTAVSPAQDLSYYTLESDAADFDTMAPPVTTLLQTNTYGVQIAAFNAAGQPTVLSSQINPDVDIDSLFGGIIDIINKIAFYVGAILVVGGIFSLILAYKDENADQQARSIRNIVVGVSLMSLPVFLQMAGIVS